MVTVMDALLTLWALLLGRITSNALLVTRVEVSIKKIRRRNTRSVIDAMLNSALTLLRPRKFMAKSVREVGRETR